MVKPVLEKLVCWLIKQLINTTKKFNKSSSSINHKKKIPLSSALHTTNAKLHGDRVYYLRFIKRNMLAIKNIFHVTTIRKISCTPTLYLRVPDQHIQCKSDGWAGGFSSRQVQIQHCGHQVVIMELSWLQMFFLYKSKTRSTLFKGLKN